MEPLVSTQWLAKELVTPNLVLLDASKHLPGAQRDAAAEFLAGHIPGALFLDLPSLTDASGPVPNAPPSRAQFDARLSSLGVTDSSRIVLYDDSALRTSARAWFLFRLFGVKNVALLDGGMQKWRAEGRPLEQGATHAAPSQFSSEGALGAIRTKADMLANIDSKAAQVVDARDGPRFRGEVPDIRPNMPSGHIPGSYNLPYAAILNPDTTFKDADAIRAAFADAGVDLNQPIVTSCGSGMTASVLLFALHLVNKGGALYDGSWSEWGADPDMPVETGLGAVGTKA